ncbi:MAG: tRNA (adenosine(37)-N6)-threonylcarbamoyltransferase complex dimerization subunit type 1 TsaB [Candidatus Krumholzibacteria bacterium]|nr:tRNA (adenosine(37)-N6)-threonylcarbamoyltransferase complex dimerization subunit type 1 TsaB [Candidatus Krumholzibacteria bacterium]
MVVIALDTSHARGGAALAVDGRVRGERTFGDTSHLVELARSVDSLLRDAGLGARDVERVAIVRGPGSFTGLRVGLAWAKGLCAGSGASLVTMGSLELIARAHAGAGVVCAMIDARREEIYGALFEVAASGGDDGPATIVEPCARAPESFLRALPRAPRLAAGTGALRYAALMREVFPEVVIAGADGAQPSAALLARLAPRLEPAGAQRLREMEPVYLRAGVAKPLKPIDADGRTHH